MPGASSGFFKINPDTGEVVTTIALDREVREVFSLRGKGCLTMLTNESRQQEVSGEILYFCGVSLRKLLLTQCYPVSWVWCSLVGAIYFRHEFMAKVCAIFYVSSVLVRDGGVPSLSGTATILCTVEDENDHAPEIIVPGHDIEVLENQGPGVVYTVLASDMDAGNNGAVRYRVIGEYFRH